MSCGAKKKASRLIFVIWKLPSVIGFGDLKDLHYSFHFWSLTALQESRSSTNHCFAF